MLIAVTSDDYKTEVRRVRVGVGDGRENDYLDFFEAVILYNL